MREHRYRAWYEGVLWEVWRIEWHRGKPCAVSLKHDVSNQYWFDSGSEPINLMQYTGLHDCKGAEIFEGDLLELDGGGDKARGEVIFEDGCFCFKAPWIEDGKKYPELKYYIDMTFVEAEVIGNIHQHHDLLNKE